MDIRRAVAEVLWIGFEDSYLSEPLKSQLIAGDVGGVVLFRRNLPLVTIAETEKSSLGGELKHSALETAPASAYAAHVDAAALRALCDELHNAVPSDMD